MIMQSKPVQRLTETKSQTKTNEPPKPVRVDPADIKILGVCKNLFNDYNSTYYVGYDGKRYYIFKGQALEAAEEYWPSDACWDNGCYEF